MTNWLVTLINTDHPFEKRQVVVPAETVIEALDEFHHKQTGFVACSAAFHSSFQANQIAYEEAVGYGWGPLAQ